MKCINYLVGGAVQMAFDSCDCYLRIVIFGEDGSFGNMVLEKAECLKRKRINVTAYDSKTTFRHDTLLVWRLCYIINFRKVHFDGQLMPQ